MRILIVENEKDLARTIVAYLRRENYRCDKADSVSTAVEKIEACDYDCILLDSAIPDSSLILSDPYASVIVISASDSFQDRIAALNLGADDYLAKPLHLSELRARIATIIRRKRFQGQNLIAVNGLAIDLVAKTVMAQTTPVELTRKEFDLLLYLVSNKNKVISRNAIAENISDDDLHKNVDFVYAHIKNLKRKLAAAGCADYIKSVYGVGYKFSE